MGGTPDALPRSYHRLGVPAGPHHRGFLLFRKCCFPTPTRPNQCTEIDSQLPGNWSVADFFSSYFSIMFFVVLYFGYKIYGKTKIVPLSEVPVGQWIALADANPEPEPTPKKGWKGWFARIWWD
jgi:hypothetical protein